VLAGQSTIKYFLVELVVTEALATFHAVELCQEMSFFDLILEGKALQIINAVKTTSTNWSTFGHIVDGIKHDLSQLRSWRIEHVKKNTNTAAHTIA